MTSRFAVPLLACPLLICGFFTLAAAQQSDQQGNDAPAVPSRSSVPRWEYESIEASPGDSQSAQLQEMGAHGWELAAVVPLDEDGHTNRLIYYFKRPK